MNRLDFLIKELSRLTTKRRLIIKNIGVMLFSGKKLNLAKNGFCQIYHKKCGSLVRMILENNIFYSLFEVQRKNIRNLLLISAITREKAHQFYMDSSLCSFINKTLLITLGFIS